MALPPLPEVRYVTTEAAMTALESLASDIPQLRALAHDWFPDLDEFDRRAVAERLAVGLTGLRGLLDARRQRMIKSGDIVMPS